jgi:hypothetical protein
MCRDRSPLYALGLLSFIGFVLIIVGGGVPNWRMQEGTLAETFDYHYGPFTVCTKSKDNYDNCERIDPRDDNVDGVKVTDEFRAVQAFVLLAILSAFIGSISAVFHGCKGSSMKTDGVVLQLLAGVFGLIATALWVRYETDNEKCETMEDTLGIVKLHECYWAFSVFTAGWVCSLLSAVLMAFT